MEGSHQVLAGRSVDAGLSTDGGVHHGQQGGGRLNHRDPPQPGGGREAGQIRRRSTAQADNEPVAPQAEGTESFP